MAKPKAILLLGPTGSGKTPLGEELQRRGLGARRCVHFDFGARLRAIADGALHPPGLHREDTEFLTAILRTGALLENEHFPIAERILRAFIETSNLADDDLIVLNGLPRHPGQARAVSGTLRVVAVVELACAAPVVVERLRADPGGDRGGRPDDALQMVERKLDTYARRTAPLRDYYAALGVPVHTIEVDACDCGRSLWRSLVGFL